MTIISVGRKKEVIVAVLMLPLKCTCCIALVSFVVKILAVFIDQSFYYIVRKLS